MELLIDGLTLLKGNGEMPVLQILLSTTYQSHYNRKNCIYHTEIYKQHNARGHKVSGL